MSQTTRDWVRAAVVAAARPELAEEQIPGLIGMYPWLTADDCRVVNRTDDAPLLSTDAELFRTYPWVVEYDRTAYSRNAC